MHVLCYDASAKHSIMRNATYRLFHSHVRVMIFLLTQQGEQEYMYTHFLN